MAPEGLLQLSGGLRYAPIFSHRYIMLFNFDPIGIRRQSLLLLRCGQRDVQDAILELCVDVFLLHGVTHIETAGAGAGEGLAAQVAAVLIFLIVRVAADSLNGQVAIVQFHLNVFLLAARQVNSYFVAIVRLFDVGLHHVCTTLTKGTTSLTVHRTFQCSVIPERIEEIIEQV